MQLQVARDDPLCLILKVHRHIRTAGLSILGWVVNPAPALFLFLLRSPGLHSRPHSQSKSHLSTPRERAALSDCPGHPILPWCWSGTTLDMSWYHRPPIEHPFLSCSETHNPSHPLIVTNTLLHQLSGLTDISSRRRVRLRALAASHCQCAASELGLHSGAKAAEDSRSLVHARGSGNSETPH